MQLAFRQAAFQLFVEVGSHYAPIPAVPLLNISIETDSGSLFHNGSISLTA
jgi:hypothetical protein